MRGEETHSIRPIQRKQDKVFCKAKEGFGRLKPGFSSLRFLRVFEGFFFFNLGLVICNEDRVAGRLTSVEIYLCCNPALDLSSWSVSWGGETHQVFVLRCQAFVSGKKGGEACRLVCPLPIYLPSRDLSNSQTTAPHTVRRTSDFTVHTSTLDDQGFRKLNIPGCPGVSVYLMFRRLQQENHKSKASLSYTANSKQA